MNNEEKEKLEELITAVRNKLSPEEFYRLMNGILDMPEDELDELFKMAVLIEETTNQ